MGAKIRYTFEDGKTNIFPINKLVSNWLFQDIEKEEAILCNSIAEVAEKNGLDQNDLQHLFPTILRMLKSDIKWANNIKPKEEIIIVEDMLRWWNNKSGKEQFDLREKYPEFCEMNNKVYYCKIFKAEMSGGLTIQQKSDKILNWWYDISHEERKRLIAKYPDSSVDNLVNYGEIYEKEFSKKDTTIIDWWFGLSETDQFNLREKYGILKLSDTDLPILFTNEHQIKNSDDK